jgi:hypothetical protein
VGRVLVWVRRARARALEKRDIRWFEYRHDFTESATDFWNIDLVEMSLTTRREVRDMVIDIRAGHWVVRRRDGGIWKVKRTADTLAREVGELTNNLETCDETEREELAAELKELQSATWEPMDGEIAAPLESQYQRFILHYSGV